MIVSAAAHLLTDRRASATMRPDIFDVPSVLSENEIGISTTLPPARTISRTISIWKP